MSRIEELRADVAELEKLADQAQRTKVKDVLNMEIRKIQTTIASLSEKEKSASNENQTKSPVSSTPAACKRPHKTITNYGWDQSEKFMKIYVTLNGIQTINKDNVVCSFSDRSFRLSITDFEGKDQTLGVPNLHDKIIPADSYHKIKTDMVLLMLKKAETGKTWPYVIQKKEQKKEESKPEESGADADPQDGLMKMLKKMYDEGDDEMKRTIAKTWSQSQENKAGGGMPGMAGMPGMGGLGDL